MSTPDERHDHYQLIAEHLSDLICLVDAQLIIRYASPSWGRLLSREPQQLIGQQIPALVHPEDRPALEEELATMLGGVEVANTFRLAASDGQWRWWELTGQLLSLHGQPMLLTVLRDVTERKREHEALFQAQKLESLGLLSSSVAHEFNNLLVAILGNAGMALIEMSPADPARQLVQQIELAAQHAADLTRQLLAFAGRSGRSVAPLILTGVVESTARLMRMSIARSITITISAPAELPPIMADQLQMQQLVLNLLSNAAEAIGDASGAIVLTTGAIWADRTYLSRRCLAPGLPEGCYVYLDVKDDGCGIDPAIMGRICDPFFTTKPGRRGLGLASVLGILRGHRGAMHIESTHGSGSRFRVLLPAQG